MKKTLSLILIVGVILLGAALAAHHSPLNSTLDNNNSMKFPPVRISLGDPKKSDLNAPGSSVDNHPSGTNFFQYDWIDGNLGTVEFIHGKHSFVIDNALSALGTDAKGVPEGIYQWSINFGVSPEQLNTHESALARIEKLFSDLRKAGWIRYIGINHPRLIGRQAWNYIKFNPVYSLDPNYMPTIDEWKAITKKMPHWIFYADGVYLDVSLIESNAEGLIDKSTYLLTINIKNEYSFYGIGYFPGNSQKIANWKTLLPAELQTYHADRLKTEADLKEQGYTIDTTYQDPPIKALQGSSTNPQ